MIRLVKMQFTPETADIFPAIFKEAQPLIAAFPGCSGVSLLRCETDPTIFFTYSIWENEEALNTYRASDLFNKTWAKTKPLFAEKAQAWSVSEI